MTVRNLLAHAAVALLAACQAPAPEQGNEAVDRADAAPDTADAFDRAPLSNGGQEGRAVIADKRLPAAFLGRWGLVPADCTSTRGDNKGLMTVEPDRLSFYESRATITRLEGVSPTELHATLAFSGEGQEWMENTPLTLQDNGNALIRVAEGQALRYTRCPA